MLEAPTIRRDDPRALRYIVDHLAPGKTIRRKILVTNRTGQTRRIEIYPGAATVEHERFTFPDGRAGNELSSWISVDRTTLELKPWAEGQVRATIAVPSSASEGERYGVIWAATTSLPQESGQVTQIHRIGIRTYLNIGPGGEPVSDFTIGDLMPSRSREGDPSVAIQVTNTGARALDLTGQVTLAEGPAGIRAGPFDVVQGTTLSAGQSGQVLARLPRDLPNGPWKITVNLESGLVKKTITRRIEFPDPGEVGRPATVLSQLAERWKLAAMAAGIPALAGLIVLARRSRSRRSVSG